MPERGIQKSNYVYCITKEGICQMEDELYCSYCGREIRRGEKVLYKKDNAYCADCAVDLFLTTYNPPDEFDIADWKRKDMMLW